MNIKHLTLALALIACVAAANGQKRLPGYVQAEKFTRSKLNTMLFSTRLTPHWMENGSMFWYQYKTSDGDFWYVVNPVTRQKTPLWDRDELASQLTTIVKDPFEARHLPIEKLKAKDDGHTFTFQVRSSQDYEQPKKKEGEENK